MRSPPSPRRVGARRDRLAGSETAIIVGGTGGPTPSVPYAHTAEDLYLRPLGFDGGATDSAVCHMDDTDPCSAPLQVLTTPELLQQSNQADTDIITKAIEAEYAIGRFDADHPLTVFGYSQGATAESMAMVELAHDGKVPEDAVHFVFIGDPSAPDGIWPHLELALDTVFGRGLTDGVVGVLGMTPSLGNLTPDDLYPATIYSLPDDPVANFVDANARYGLFGALLGLFGPHAEYLGLTPEQVADATVTTDGWLRYADINDDDINGAETWLNAVLHGGGAGGDPLQTVVDSLAQLIIDNL